MFNFLSPLLSLVSPVPKSGRRTSSDIPWDADYGGWGGREYFMSRNGRRDEAPPAWKLYDSGDIPPRTIVEQTPVVFVHGNGRSADDWTDHAEYFLEQGYSGDEVWAITFRHSTSTHEEMATQLESFVGEVREYTECQQVNIVGHSLGVTGVRYWMYVNNRHDWVDTFVGIGGANHGLPAAQYSITLPGMLTNRHLQVLDYLTSDRESETASVQLEELNSHGPTSDVTYYTIRGEYDSFFAGDRESPVIQWAEENVSLPLDHDGIRNSDRAIRLIHDWVTAGGQKN